MLVFKFECSVKALLLHSFNTSAVFGEAVCGVFLVLLVVVLVVSL